MTGAAGLTRHIKSGVSCTFRMRAIGKCGNRTWELCDKCGQAICGLHILPHYRAMHPTMI